MRFFLRVTFALLVLAGGGTGCSTPQRRAREHPAAFHRLSLADQALVLRGRVRPGMNQDAVYIAWGEPDRKTASNDGKGSTGIERWIYIQRVSILEPQNSSDYFGPYHGLGGSPAGLSLRADDGIRETGNEAFIWFQPHVHSFDTLRIAEFRDGKVENAK